MKKLWVPLCVLLMACGYANSSYAKIIWVGESTACSAQSLAVKTLALGIGAAYLSTDSNNEIRLTTKGTSYTGVAGRYTISNWSGILTIAGGYSDCGVTSSSRLVMGHSSQPVFTVNKSTVIFKNITMKLSDTRALVVNNFATVVLDNVMIDNNQSGIEVKANSYVDVKANSIVQNNNDVATAKGGGIYCYDNSQVTMSGKVVGNSAVKGGNILAETGCFVELSQKSFVTDGTASDSGGGLLIDNGGELLASGGAELVVIDGNKADINGGGIFVWGTGRVTLQNTYLDGNYAGNKGSAIFAANSGTLISQLTMDRVADCPFLISCSVIQGHSFVQSVVYVNNSKVTINRTIAHANLYSGGYATSTSSIFHAAIDAYLKLNWVAAVNNETPAILSNDGESQTDVTHMTAAKNKIFVSGPGWLDSWALLGLGTTSIKNSIFSDTRGLNWSGGAFDTSSKCNLVDNSAGWLAGTFVLGTPQFKNINGGDMRQVSSSPGVDMCHKADYSSSINRDIEYQVAPVNDHTNPQGNPGEDGGLYDAGVDEVYDNIGEDEFTLTVHNAGSGGGNLTSFPLGITCGTDATDCSEVYPKGTPVTLYAAVKSGSEFVGWQNCPQPNGVQCKTTINSNQLIFAVFDKTLDMIFSNGFEYDAL